MSWMDQIIMAKGGSGGGGGGGAEPLIVTVTVTHDGGYTLYTADKTYNEVKTAYNGGTPVIFLQEETGNDPEFGDWINNQSYAVVSIASLVYESSPENTSYSVVTANYCYWYPAENDPDGLLGFAESN